jgi:hypothetical protein
MTRTLAIAAALVFLISGQARGLTLLVNGTTPSVRYARILDASYVPLPDVTVDLALLDDATDACGGGGPACVSPAADSANAQMWLTKGTAPDDVVHEAAHVFDYVWMTDADRARFLAWMGERRAWRSIPDSPHERFASLVEACMRGARYMQRQVRRSEYVRSIRGFKPIYDFGYGLVLWPKKAAEGCPLVQRIADRYVP